MAAAPSAHDARERARRLAGEAHLNAALVAIDDAVRASALSASEWGRLWLEGVRAHVAREPAAGPLGASPMIELEVNAKRYFAQGYKFRCEHAFNGDRSFGERSPRKWFNVMASNAAFERMQQREADARVESELKRKRDEAAAVLRAESAAADSAGAGAGAGADAGARPAQKRPRAARKNQPRAESAEDQRLVLQFCSKPESVDWAIAPSMPLPEAESGRRRDAAYHALFTHRHDLWAPRGGGKVHTAPTALGARLAEALAAVDLLQVTAEDVRAYKQDHRRLPRPIADLGLVPFAAGSYNAVWGLRGPKAGASSPLLELVALRGADPHKVVLRTPLRDPKHASAGACKAESALDEVLKVAGAAALGVGVGLLGVALVPMEVPRDRDAVAPDEGATHVRFRVCTVLERAGHTLHARLGASDTSAGPVAAPRLKYFEALAAAVWRLSVDARIVNLDGKPENYMDFNYRDLDTNAHEPAPQVVAIDLDDVGARRLVPPTVGDAAPAAGQGWRIIWAYNTLFLSCMMRESGMDEPKYQAWFRPLQQALTTVVREVELGRPTNLRSDADYDHALLFARRARWHGRAIPTDPDAARKPVPGNDPTTVAREAMRFVAWYFYVVWHDRICVSGGAQSLEDRLDAVLECRRRNDLGAANERAHALVAAYRDEGRRRLATMRYFADRLRDGPRESAPLLLRVLLDFASADRIMMRYHYAEGRAVLTQWGGRSWPALPRAAELSKLIQPGGAWERADAPARRRELEHFFGEPQGRPSG